jgi:hypothetical protein
MQFMSKQPASGAATASTFHFGALFIGSGDCLKTFV